MICLLLRHPSESLPGQLLKQPNLKYKHRLYMIRVNSNTGMFQIRKFIEKYFHCCPQPGPAPKAGQPEKNYLAGILLYIQPQHDHLTKCGNLSQDGHAYCLHQHAENQF